MPPLSACLRLLAALTLLFVGQRGYALTLIAQGQAKAAVWVQADEAADPKSRAFTEISAAKELVEYLGKISGATVELRQAQAGQQPGEGEPAIVVGSLALKLGLPQPPKTNSGDGYRILVRGNHLLLAGESVMSTSYAVTHFLESLGCRWFFDNPIGEVVPQLKTVEVAALDIAETPDFATRLMWGPNWGATQWTRRNRMGGARASTGHAWGQVPAKKYFETHPEYFALRGGERKAGNWVCTTNPEVIRLFAEGLIASAGNDERASLSLSPPDGNGYCECDKCKALDKPENIEPSSGRIAMSDRYIVFFNAVAEQVKKVKPNVTLNFYAYADYSPPPLAQIKSPDNLCAWIAPLRFCRLHSLGDERCESRTRGKGVVDRWAQTVSQLGWREYNYQVAELCVPFSKITTWKHDIPYLKKAGAVGINIECLAMWHIYGPSTYLAARLAWDADADAQAIMDDFYSRFGGPAAPYFKSYWERIDQAIAQCPSHSGSFYSDHVFWTRQMLADSQKDLDAALAAADSDVIRQRVEMFRMGLENARYYLDLRDATLALNFVLAKDIYDRWMAHMDAVFASKVHRIGEYARGYAPRFLGKPIYEGYVRTTGDCKMLAALPDQWSFRYDAKDEGETQGWHKPGAAAEGWRQIKAYSATLTEQGVPEQLTWMWYRTTIKTGQIPAGRIALWFGEIDGAAVKLFIDGELVGEGKGGRKPSEYEITGKLKANTEHTIAVKIDHSRITELMLGGMIKPAMIYSGTPVELILTPVKHK